MTSVDKLSGDPSHVLTGFGAFTTQRERLPHWTGPPLIRRTIGFLVGEERINCDADFFALPRHDTDRVVEKRASDFRRGFRHENARVRLPPHQDRQGADVIEVRMRDDNGIERAIAEDPKVWQGIFAFLLRMHAAVEDEPLTRGLDVITIGADLGAAREVNEFQKIEEMALPPIKSKLEFPVVESKQHDPAYLSSARPQNRSTGILPGGPSGILPDSLPLRNGLEARSPHRQDACATATGRISASNFRRESLRFVRR
jgi:hypothetical protein